MVLLKLDLKESKNRNEGLEILATLKNVLPSPQLILNISFDSPSYTLGETVDTCKIGGAWIIK